MSSLHKAVRQRERDLFFFFFPPSSFHLARSATKSFSLAASNYLECALRRTKKKTVILLAFPKGIKTRKESHVRFQFKVNKTNWTGSVTMGSALILVY